MMNTAIKTKVAPFGKDVMPTNVAKLSTLDRMLNAIKHQGRPAKSKNKPSFA